MDKILNQLIYFAYFQSLFLLGIYLFSSKNRKNTNVFLTILVVVLTIGLSGRVLYLSGFFGGNERVVVFSEMSTLLFGATVFLFTRSSLFNIAFSRKDLIHYLPAVIYNCFVVAFFIYPSDETLTMRRNSGTQYLGILIFVGIGLLVNVTYWWMSIRRYQEFKAKVQNELSYTVKSQFFLNFLLAIGFCMLVWTSMYVLELLGFGVLSRTVWQMVWFSLAIIILFIAFYSIKEPDLYKVKLEIKGKKYIGSKLSPSDLNKLKEKLDKIMLDKKPYLNRKLLKSELAELLEVSNPEIARVLNECIGMNFFEYVNYYRIKEFIALAKSEKGMHMSFFGLAQEAGFNSKTTFNKSFKNLMGKTPKQYFQTEI